LSSQKSGKILSSDAAAASAAILQVLVDENARAEALVSLILPAIDGISRDGLE
jgi:hypothetical protein